MVNEESRGNDSGTSGCVLTLDLVHHWSVVRPTTGYSVESFIASNSMAEVQHPFWREFGDEHGRGPPPSRKTISETG